MVVASVGRVRTLAVAIFSGLLLAELAVAMQSHRCTSSMSFFLLFTVCLTCILLVGRGRLLFLSTAPDRVAFLDPTLALRQFFRA